MFIAVLFTRVKPWNHPRCLLRVEWIKKMWYIWHCRILGSHTNESNHVLCSNMKAAGGHHPKQINAVTENQIPHVFIYKWELKIEHIWTKT